MAFPTLLNESNISELLDSIDNVMSDCDGVLWSVDETIPDANTTLNKLRSLGKRIFFVSNNSSKSRATLVSKCQQMGFIANEDEAVPTSFVLAHYLKSMNFQKKVFIVGTSGITEELDKAGIKYCGTGPDPLPEYIFDLQYSIKLDPEVGAVVVGFDPHFNIAKVMRAASYLKKPDCIFIGTNRDEQFPTSNGDLIFPGAGVMVKCVETAVGRQADIVGKPHSRMFNVLREKFHLDPERTLMIGDRCSTDIVLGKNCGLKTLFVLTGTNSMQDLERWAQSSDPQERILLADYYIPSLGDMAKLLPS